MGEFFSNVPIEAITRVPNRPLGELSDFVVMELPTVAQGVREGRIKPDYLNERSDQLVAGVSPSRLAALLTDSKTSDLVLLDLLFLDNALARRSKLNPTLTEIIDGLSARNGRPPVLTYEDLILVNPLDTDPRTATDDKLGSTELDFYKVHNEIENELTLAIEAAKIARETLVRQGSDGLPIAVEHVQFTLLRWKRARAIERVIENRMPEVNFTSFRDYFLPHPIRKMPGTDMNYSGPSGAFSATVPVFEMILAGEVMKPDHLEYLEKNDIYFPRAERKDLHDAKIAFADGLSLSQLSMALGDRPPFIDELAEVDDEMIAYRNVHIALVKRFIYGAMEGKTSGTAGVSNVGGFLEARIYHHIDRKRCFAKYSEKPYTRDKSDL